MTSALEHRHIPMTGTPNFRDLGGYATRCGRRIKYNKVFRSGTLTFLDEQDWQTIDELNIKIICDFRRDDERLKHPTTVPPEFNIQNIQLAIDPGSHNEYVREILKTRDADHQAFYQLMCTINAEMALSYHQTFSQLIHHVSELGDDNALLFHCAAGKDRTGLGAALLLSCLNVDRQTIEQDYMLTQKYYIPGKEIKALLQGIDPDKLATLNQETTHPMLDVSLDYIRSAFKVIDEKWGGMDAYIRDGLALTDSDLEKLQDKLLS